MIGDIHIETDSGFKRITPPVFSLGDITASPLKYYDPRESEKPYPGTKFPRVFYAKIEEYFLRNGYDIMDTRIRKMDKYSSISYEVTHKKFRDSIIFFSNSEIIEIATENIRILLNAYTGNYSVENVSPISEGKEDEEKLLSRDLKILIGDIKFLNVNAADFILNKC